MRSDGAGWSARLEGRKEDMNKRGWITLVATVAVIAVAAVVGPALAHGQTDATSDGTDGGTE
jgi:hypothetical protein